MKSVFLFLFFYSVSSIAAISSQTKNSLRNSAILRGPGAIHGGLAGKGFSLLEVKTQVAKNQKLERLIVGVGDAAFQPHQGTPGYFHIENVANQKRVVINFSQTLNAKFDEKALKKTLAKSPFVKSSQIQFDPQAQTLSLVLDMKKQASVRVIPVNGTKKQMAHLKIDFFEDSLLVKGAKK